VNLLDTKSHEMPFSVQTEVQIYRLSTWRNWRMREWRKQNSCYEGPQGWQQRHTSGVRTSFLTSVIVEVSGQLHSPAGFPSGKGCLLVS